MKYKQVLIGVLSILFIRGYADVIISESFTEGVGDNTGLIAGSITDVGDVAWRANASGNWWFSGDGSSRAYSQNNLTGADPRLYLDYAGIMTVGNITTLSCNAGVNDCTRMEFGFGVDDTLLSGSSSAFWVVIDPAGNATFYARSNTGAVTLSSTVDVKYAWNDVVNISLTYNQAANTVLGMVSGLLSTNVLAETELSFTPGFDQFNFELRDEGSAQVGYGYFDDVAVGVVPEPATVGMVGLASGVIFLLRRYLMR